MILLKLTNEYDMTVERHEKKARLIVYKNGVENVCRKETVRQIERFALSNNGQLFKGRLQLHKHENTLSIEVKGNSIATINIVDFMQFLNNGQTH